MAVNSECAVMEQDQVVNIDYSNGAGNSPQNIKGSSTGSRHNRRFLLCQIRFVRVVNDCRLALIAAAGGTSGT